MGGAAVLQAWPGRTTYRPTLVYPSPTPSPAPLLIASSFASHRVLARAARRRRHVVYWAVLDNGAVVLLPVGITVVGAPGVA